jgi:hypothetical protein
MKDEDALFNCNHLASLQQVLMLDIVILPASRLWGRFKPRHHSPIMYSVISDQWGIMIIVLPITLDHSTSRAPMMLMMIMPSLATVGHHGLTCAIALLGSREIITACERYSIRNQSCKNLQLTTHIDVKCWVCLRSQESLIRNSKVTLLTHIIYLLPVHTT